MRRPATLARQSGLLHRVLTVLLLGITFATTSTVVHAATSPAAPEARAAAVVRVHIWATDVRVRTCPNTTCAPASTERLTNVSVNAFCQKLGGYVQDGQYHNRYWVQIVTPQRWLGWVSAVFVRGGANDRPVPGPPVETSTGPVYCEYP